MKPRWSAFALAVACSSPAVNPPPQAPRWRPGTLYPSPAAPNARGYLDRRGLVHAHSYLSHDACDNSLGDKGVLDKPCLDDFRRDLCRVRHDYVFLTDHDTGFSGAEFPDTLLFDASKGDVLLERDGAPVASRMRCEDGSTVLVMAGTESKAMPVGLEAHVAGTRAARSELYTSFAPEAMQAFKDKGAVVLVAHTEDWTLEQLGDTPLDGFEMYNLHENTLRAAGRALYLVGNLIQGKTEGLPHPDLVFLELFSESPEYLQKWGTVLARGARRVTTMGTDCHRNSFPQLLPDGERIDSYRRMMAWFSNHLLVRPAADGSFDDRALKDALRGARLYGAFEVMGTPAGFDFRAEAQDGVHEIGDEVALSAAPVLVATRPSLRDADAARATPELTVRILRAKEGGWDVVATGGGDLRYTPTEPGAYRAEVRMRPLHLREDLGENAEALLAQDYPWIYANAIRVR
jgi:hypothetical protein